MIGSLQQIFFFIEIVVGVEVKISAFLSLSRTLSLFFFEWTITAVVDQIGSTGIFLSDRNTTGQRLSLLKPHSSGFL